MSLQDTVINNKEKTREEKITKLIESCSESIKNIPLERIERLRLSYINDKRSYEEIQQEIIALANRAKNIEQLINTDIDSDILKNSIIIIGPMGSGKSTIANLLREKTNMPRISLDDREQLSRLYDQQHNFDNFKEFEFYLTGMVLTNLKEPTIIDFGAGHSIYEDTMLFLEIKSLITKFSNVVLLMPSEDKEESVVISNERKGIKSGSIEDFDNRHFVDMPCNYELATITKYTKDKTPDQIANEIINQINQKCDNNRKQM